MNHIEIERKWIVREEFKSEFKPEILVHSNYFSTSPLSVRAQSKTIIGAATEKPFKYWLTIKNEGDLSRIEIEKELTEEEFNILATIEHHYVNKLYNSHFYGLQTSISVNESGRSLFYAEMEFETEIEANAFIPPDIVEREITYEAEYKMDRFALLPKE
jgi:CYTH domain-containing protein